MERKQETKVVKKALTDAGFKNVFIKHGTGTGWGWLKAKADYFTPKGCYCKLEFGARETCHFCRDAWQSQYRCAVETIQAATGRRGNYDGNINVDLVRE